MHLGEVYALRLPIVDHLIDVLDTSQVVTTVRRQFHQPPVDDFDATRHLHTMAAHKGGVVEEAADFCAAVERAKGVQDKDALALSTCLAPGRRILHELAHVVVNRLEKILPGQARQEGLRKAGHGPKVRMPIWRGGSVESFDKEGIAQLAEQALLDKGRCECCEFVLPRLLSALHCAHHLLTHIRKEPVAHARPLQGRSEYGRLGELPRRLSWPSFRLL
mmetsp:Transcript_121344/g.259068  ORF Transcript_121344/g.259068 Transcript_121344/m.259068 type:complete len:219 (-) Transcript_121344:642-1298(-)